MRFGAPDYFWLLLLVPALVLFLAWAAVRKRRALARFAHRSMVARLIDHHSAGWQYARYLFLLAGVFFLVLALTGPQFGARTEVGKRRGVDVMVALDVSRSMLAGDVKPTRLERAKHQIAELLDQLGGDRVGLVVFAGHAFVQCPLTVDYGALQLFLDLADTGVVPVQGTALADAIELAARCLPESEGQDQAIALFTDGENHLGDPVAAARAVAARGIRIFAVGIGSPGGELIPDLKTGGYHQDREGNYVKSRLDEEILEKVAQASEGAYFRSTLAGGEVGQIHDYLSQMDQREFGSTRFTRYEERFQFCLLPALLCFLAEACLPEGRRRAGEWRGRFA
ncbi:MAG: VWA domain-containing protein [Candidatus Latescibacteria bacterium]|nr:VWA domain-containing protein [Candidatus Latescibacterota bacterium]